MRTFRPELRTLHVGSMPHTDPRRACQLVFAHFPDIPAWPQLPRRTFNENMYAQFSERFPGVVIEPERMWVDRAQDLAEQIFALTAGVSQAMRERYSSCKR